MLKEAILHKMDQEFCYALKEGTFLIRIRTKRDDLKKITLWFTEKYGSICQNNEKHSINMIKISCDDLFDYYEVVLNYHALVAKYFFELQDYEDNIIYYGNYRFLGTKITEQPMMFDIPERAREVEQFPMIDWVSEGIVYQIFPDRFFRGSKQKLSGLCDWNKTPEWHDIFGGTINGIKEKLDYLRELGVTILYLTPIFESTSNHKYNTTDYLKIDQDFGTKEDLKKLVSEAHEYGIRVILDGVFNHTGTEFKPFQDVLEHGEKSVYKDWFRIKEFPLVAKKNEKPNYGTFAYHGGMPQLNPDNKEVKAYIKKVIDYWMTECDIDGWRLDVADEVSHQFWKDFRTFVKIHKEDAPVIGEIWYESTPWLMGDEFDSVMNYLFYNNVMAFVGSRTIRPSEFANQVGFLRGRYHNSGYQMLWNLIDSHDCERFLSYVKGDKRKLKLAALIQLTMTGTPMIYYGDEIGMTGGIDPDCRKGMIWEEDRQDYDMLSYYKTLIRLRKSSKALMNGEFRPIIVDDRKNFIIYEKRYKEDIFYVAINNGEETVEHSMLESIDLITGNSLDGRLDASWGAILQG